MWKPSRCLAALLTGVVLTFVLSSCDSDGGKDSSASSRTVVSSVPPGRASAPLRFSGDRGLAGVVRDAEVTCHFPDVAGLRLSVFARAPRSTVTYRIAVAADKVVVQVDSGAGSTFRERNFEGTGVTDFDAATGARIDADLTESAPTPGISPGSIGRITAVKGTVDCGKQTPGSSTLTVTGDTLTGRYQSSPLDPVLVECYPASGQVTAIGIARSGVTRTLVMISLNDDGSLNLEEAPGGATPRYYGSLDGSATLTDTGGHADGTVVERDATPAHTVRIGGDVTCGTPIRT